MNKWRLGPVTPGDDTSAVEASSFGGAVVRLYRETGGTWVVETGEPGPAGWESGCESIGIGAGAAARRIAELVATSVADDRGWPLVREPDRDDEGVAAIVPPLTPGDVVVLLRRLRWAWSEPDAADVSEAGIDPGAVERACVSALAALAPAADCDRDPVLRLGALADEITVVAEQLTA